MKSLVQIVALIIAWFVSSTVQAALPAAPQNLQQAWLGTESLLLWEAVSEATGYNVYRADDTNTAWALVASGLVVPRWRDEGWQFLPSHYFVTAVNADGEGLPSDSATVQVAWGYTISITPLSAWWYGNVTPTNATVNWATSNPDGDQGIVEWGAAETNGTNFAFFMMNTNYLPWHTFVLTNLAPATFYNYRVTSISPNRGGVSVVNSFATPDTNHAPAVLGEIFYGNGVLFSVTDTDQPPQTIAYEFIAPTNGTVSGPFSQGVNVWGVLYTPNPGARGLDSMTFVAHDGVESSVPCVITFSNWLNRLPEAGWQGTNTLEDMPVEISLPNFDPDGDPITFELIYISGGTIAGTPPHLLFTPDTNVTDGGIHYLVADGYGSNYGFVQIFITPVNDKPVAQSQSLSTWEDTPLFITPGFTDVEGGSFTLSIVRGPTNGVLSGQNFALQYVPAANFSGFDSFDFVVAEPDGTTSDLATVTIEVLAVNDPPSVPVQTVLTPEDTAVSFVLDATDAESDPLTYWINSGPVQGTLSGTMPNLTYTPPAGFFGTAVFNYSATDGLESRANNVTIRVGENSLPEVTGLRRRIYSDGGVRLWWNSVSSAQHYAVYRANGSNAPFTLLAGQISATNFTDSTAQYQQPYFYCIRAWDGTAYGAPSGVIFAQWDDTGVVTVNQQYWNIRGLSAQVQFYSSLVAGTEGLWEYGATTNYDRVLENTNLLPSQSFTLTNLTPQTIYYYRLTATDGKGNAVSYQNNFATEMPPIANPQSVSGAEDTALNITLSGTEPNYTFHPLTYSLVSGPAHGTLTWTGGNTIRYLAATNYNGGDAFSFRVHNGELYSGAATVSINVTPVNDAPVASNISFTVPEDTSATRAPAFSDLEGGVMIPQIVSQPAHGVAGVVGTNLVYQPATNYNGADSFTYRLFDGQASGNTATASITVTPVNDLPAALNQTVTIPEDVSTNITPTIVDPDSAGPFSVIYLTQPAHGTLTLPGVGSTRTYTPNANYFGTDSYTYIAGDGSGYGNVGTITINITPVNDAPDAISKAYGISEDTTLNVNLASLAQDADGDPLTYTITLYPSLGTLSGTPPNLVYRPPTNYWGYANFKFRVSDGQLSTPDREISITINSVNDAPVAVNTTNTVAEDGVLSFGPSSTDVDGFPATYRVVSGPTNGTLVISGSNSNLWTYHPATNFFGTDTIRFIPNDLMTDGNVGTATIIVTPVNDSPAAQPGSATVAEDSSTVIALTASDVDGDALAFSVLTGPIHGTLTGTGPSRTYTSDADYNGPDSFTFYVNDGSTNSTTATVSITVTTVNDAPVANAQVVTLNEDTATNFVLTGSDVEGSLLTFAIVSSPGHGTLTGTSPNLTYTSAANFNGADSFTFQVSDGTTSSVAVVVLTVTPVNDAPVASAQSLSTAEDTALPITLTGFDADGDMLNFIVVTAPMHGTLSGTVPNLTYTPAANYNGPDSFTFKASDGNLDSATMTVSLTVSAVNDAPVAVAQSLSTAEDTALPITLAGTDVDGNAVTYLVITGPTNGTLNTTTSSNVIYTPSGNYSGPDSFVFRVSDGSATSTATVSLNVTPMNDAPVANAQSVSLAEDASLPITLTGSDVEGSTLTYLIVSGPTHGTLSGAAPNFTYTPVGNFNGADSFTFRVNDGALNSGAATVNTTVTPVNDAPIANAQSVSVAEDTSLAITLTGSDVEGSALTYTVIAGPTQGTLTGTAPNLTYRAATNYNGADSFTFRVNDGALNSGTATVSINVTAVNDAPVANAQSVTVTYNTAKIVTLTGSDTEGSALTYTVVSGPTNGTLSGPAPNLTYTPNTGSAGADRFTFRVNDGGSNSAPATVSITTLNPVAISTAPTALTVTVPTATGTLILNWSCTATNEDGFKIERSLNGSSGWSQIATTGINIHTFTNTGLTTNTRYYYRVRSYNLLGNSAYSGTVNARAR